MARENAARPAELGLVRPRTITPAVETDSTPSSATLRRALWPSAAIGCSLLVCVSIAYDASQIAAAGDSIPWAALGAGQIFNWYSCLLFVPAIAWLTARLPVHGARWPLALITHLGADSVLASLKLVLFFGIGEVSSGAGLPFVAESAADFDFQFVTIAGLTGLAHLIRARLHKVLLAVDAPEAALAPPPGHFAARDSKGFRLIRPQEILWADAQGNYARLHTLYGRHLIRSTMSALERSLDPRRFVRIHRRLIVNADHITRIDRHGPGTYNLQLADGSELRSARSYSDRISHLVG